MWVLNYLKYYKDPDFTPYRYDQDYFGFFPLPNQKYQIKPLKADLPHYDLIYLADTYGVYADDFYWKSQRGAFSKRLYGGLLSAEIDLIRSKLKEGNTLIAEFNDFADPTTQPEREALARLLGIHWSGWIGRYFNDLKKNFEVPESVIQSYQRGKGGDWFYHGPGFVFVHMSGRVVVMPHPNNIRSGGVRLVFPKEMEEFYGVKNNVAYYYWFDVVESEGASRILANFEFDLTLQGKAVLAEAGIPERFPAILKNVQNDYQSYYFAGDFVDVHPTPFWWQFKNLDLIYRYLEIVNPQSTTYFYWKVYVPFIKRVLGEIQAKRIEKLRESASSIHRPLVSSGSWYSF